MERTKTFVNGGRLYPGDINAIEDRAAEMLEGTQAAIPGSHYAGRFYRATDTNGLFIDSGTSWEYAGKLFYSSHSSSYTAKNGELGNIEKTGEVATLPAATIPNQVIGVYCGFLATECSIKTTGGALIYGNFTKEASTISLASLQYVILQSTGVNWIIIAGQPLNENSYTAQVEHIANPGGYEEIISATRPSYAVVEVPTGSVEIFVGGVSVGNVSGVGSLGLIVPAKQKIKVTALSSVKFFLAHLIQ